MFRTLLINQNERISSSFPSSRPPILFQRQRRNSNSVQVEIPIDNASNSLINGNSSLTTEHPEHQSTTSSQTITTIASINRLSDNEFTLMSASSETTADVTTLIKPNGRLDLTMRDGIRMGRDEDFEIMTQISHENLNCNSRRSSSRCSDRNNNNWNENPVSITDHKIAEQHCKNVNISNSKELNKALIPIAHLSPRGRLTRNESSYLGGARCEMGIR